MTNKTPCKDGAVETPLAIKIKDAARLLSCSQITIRRLIERGKLKPMRISRHVLIPRDQLLKLVEVGQ